MSTWELAGEGEAGVCFDRIDLSPEELDGSRRNSVGVILTSDIVMVQPRDSTSVTQDTPLTSWNSKEQSDGSNPSAENMGSPNHLPVNGNTEQRRNVHEAAGADGEVSLVGPEMSAQQRIDARLFISGQNSTTSLLSDGNGKLSNEGADLVSVLPVPAFETSHLFNQRRIIEKIHTPTAGSERRNLPLLLDKSVHPQGSRPPNLQEASSFRGPATSPGQDIFEENLQFFVSDLPESLPDSSRDHPEGTAPNIEQTAGQNSLGDRLDSPRAIWNAERKLSFSTSESKQTNRSSIDDKMEDEGMGDLREHRVWQSQQRKHLLPESPLGLGTASLGVDLVSSLVHGIEDTVVEEQTEEGRDEEEGEEKGQHEEKEAGTDRTAQDAAEDPNGDPTETSWLIERAHPRTASLGRTMSSLDPVTEIERVDSTNERASYTDPTMKANGMMVAETGFGKGGKLIADRFIQKIGRTSSSSSSVQDNGEMAPPETNSQFLQRKFSGLVGQNEESEGAWGTVRKASVETLERSSTLPSFTAGLTRRRKSSIVRQASYPRNLSDASSFMSFTDRDKTDEEIDELIRILGNEVPLSFEVSEKVPRVKDPLFHRIYFAKAGGLFLIRSDESASTLHARPAKVKDIESIREYPYNYARLTVVVKENWFAKRLYEFQFACPTGKQEFMDIMKELLPNITLYV